MKALFESISIVIFLVFIKRWQSLCFFPKDRYNYIISSKSAINKFVKFFVFASATHWQPNARIKAKNTQKVPTPEH